MRTRIGIGIVMLLALASVAEAQSQFPPPTGPVTICVNQATPLGSSHKMSFDGAAQENVTIAATPVCSAPGETGFQLPASRFVLGQHTIRITAISAGGLTSTGPQFDIVVDVAPGLVTVTRVVTSTGASIAPRK